MATQGFDWASLDMTRAAAAGAVADAPESGLLDKVIDATQRVEPTVIEAIERASVDIQISTAKRFPRGNMQVIEARILAAATMDPETAGRCFYVLKRKARGGGENKIEGPSIRLAEFCFVLYQNMRGSATVVGNDGKKVTARGECHDLENNVFFSESADRSILNTDGNIFSNDMQVMTGNACKSIAFRNAVFRVVPKTLVNRVMKKCQLVALGGMKSLRDQWAICVERFSKGGINERQLLDWCEKESVSEITWDDTADLIGLFTALIEKQTTVEEAFGASGSRKSQEKVQQEKIEQLQKQQSEKKQTGGEQPKQEVPQETKTEPATTVVTGTVELKPAFGGFGKKKE
jgi:hypothetical protein